MVKTKKECFEKVYNAVKNYYANRPCKDCHSGNGCDDCRGCKDGEIDYRMWAEVDKLKSEYEKMFNTKYDEDKKIFIENKVEGLVKEETKPKYEDEVNGECYSTTEYYSTTKYLVRPSGYQFVDENGNVINATKITLEKKKNEYPKTYEECCKILGYCSYNVGFDRCETSFEESLHNTLLALRKLIICRNAYWKIAGEGIWNTGKPWEPTTEVVFCISRINNRIELLYKSGKSDILEFPTPEMRDAFYENFKNEIELCKELL